MRFKIFAAAITLALSAASAETPLPQLRIEPTTGGSIFYVKNVTSQPLTGYLIELVDYPGSSYMLWQDELGGEPIAAGKEKRIQVGNMTVGAVPDYVKVRAAVYADGSTAGLPAKLAQLLERRNFTLQTVRQTIDRLQKAKDAKLEKDALLANIKQAASFMQVRGAPDTQLVINRNAGMKVLSDTAAQLEKNSLDETLKWLHDYESALASSKPGLGG